jgi:2-amino-4-hydroxy-6-hydroxymethyldihydropteridine diphosphokinase
LKTVHIGLGSNLGDRAAQLAEACRRMEESGIAISRASSIYETAPRDITDQPWFLNQVVEAQTECLPRQLMARLLRIERAMGRRRVVPKGPRSIDLDILYYGDSVIAIPALQIPHPRIADRRFVLEPLAELASEFRDPRTGLSVRQMLSAVADQALRPWAARGGEAAPQAIGS